MGCYKVLAAFTILGALAGSARAADSSIISRTIAKEPVYKKEPKYCLIVFGPEATTRVWLVLDGDVLYVDKNGNGNLTEPGERLIPNNPKDGSNKFNYPGLFKAEFDVYDFEVDVCKSKGSARFRLDRWIRDEFFQPHTEVDKAFQKKMLENRWEVATLWRKVGENLSAQNRVVFAHSPADAQICHFDRPLTFGLKLDSKQRLKPSKNGSDLALYIGTPGKSARNADDQVFSPLLTIEVPAQHSLIADIDFPSKKPHGSPIHVRVPLKERC
jgi:hypothetical protein